MTFIFEVFFTMFKAGKKLFRSIGTKYLFLQFQNALLLLGWQISDLLVSQLQDLHDKLGFFGVRRSEGCRDLRRIS